MTKITATTLSIALACATLAASLFAATPAVAREGNSIGGGVKCYWVLVSAVNGVNTYQQVCRKGV